jgi:outer membrane murein-binding lipoprotein Lpp
MDRATAVKTSAFVVLLCFCVMLLGCADKKRITELEQSNKDLQAQVDKLIQESSVKDEALSARQSEIASLKTELTTARMLPSVTNALTAATANATATGKKTTLGTKPATRTKASSAKSAKKQPAQSSY